MPNEIITHIRTVTYTQEELMKSLGFDASTYDYVEIWMPDTKTLQLRIKKSDPVINVVNQQARLAQWIERMLGTHEMRVRFSHLAHGGKMSYDNRKDVAAKIDWEGGIWSVLEYGLKEDDMPEGDTELREAWRALRIAFKAAEECALKVEKLLPEPWEYEVDD